MARFLLTLLAVIVVLMVAAVLLVPMFLDKERVVEMATEAIREQTGATLDIAGDLDLSIFPTLGVSFTDATVTMAGSERPDLEVGAAEIGVQLMPLLSRRVEIDTIAVDGLTARLVAAPETERVDTSTLDDAQLDAWYAQQRQRREAAGQAAGAEAALAVPLALDVTRLRVANSRIETLDPATSTTSVVELRALDASGLNLEGRPIPLAVVLHVPGEQPIDVAVDGSVVVQADSDTVSMEDMKIAIDGATAESLALVVSGVADVARQSADLQLQLDLGEASGSGTLRYASFESPQIDADLTLDLFDPALFALAGPGAAEAAPDSGETTGDEPLPLDALRAIDTRALLRIDAARFDAHTIHSLALRLRAREGVIEFSEVSGELHGGLLDAAGTFNGRHNTATLDTSGSLDGLDLATALAASGSAGLMEGEADAHWKLASRGGTVNQLVAAMTGPVTLTTREVVLKGTSVEKLVCQAVALTNQEKLTTSFEPDTRFTALVANLEIADGRAELTPLRAELAHVKLSGKGELDLLEQDFSATFKARLSPGLEEVDRACRVSKRLTAIDFPVRCRGNTAGVPGDWCKVDTEQILKDLAVNEGRRQIEQEAGKLFRKFLGGDKSGEKSQTGAN